MQYIYKDDKIKLIVKTDLIGYYLIVYEDPYSSKSSSDYLVDTLDDAFQEAYDRFGILKSKWYQFSS